MTYLITFESTAHAIKAENILLEHNIALKIRPLPNEISAGCGICIVFDELDKVRSLVKEDKFKYNQLYEHVDKDYILIT